MSNLASKLLEMTKKPKECGGCTACCKSMGIAELSKPRDVWCQHCDKGRGCSIYATKPEECNTFSCLWLSTPSMKDALRPDRSKCVIVSDPTGTIPIVHVDINHPHAWRRDATVQFLGMILDGNEGVRIVIVCGTSVKILKRTGNNEVTEYSATYPEFAGKTEGEVQITYDKHTPLVTHRLDEWIGTLPRPMQDRLPERGLRNPLHRSA